MSRPSIATPCPAPHPLSGIRRLSTASIGSAQDDTADLEYTRAITQEFKNAKPRRRSTFQRRERKDAPITIFEDVVEDQELVIAESKREIGGSTLLGKAARKMPRSSMARPQESIAEEALAQNEDRSKRRVSTLADSVPGLRFKMSEPIKEAPQETKPQGGLKKDPRRRTIFVPSDDTTMFTIHPGAHNTDRLNDTFQLPSLPQQHQPSAQAPPFEQMTEAPPRAATRRPRMSLAVAPKRLPLQQMGADKGNVLAIDVPGQNGGKENLPPRGQITAATNDKKPISRLYAPTAASQARGSVQARKATQAPKELQRSRPANTINVPSSRSVTVGAKQSLSAPVTQHSGNAAKPFVPSQRPRSSLLNGGASHVRHNSAAAQSMFKPNPPKTSQAPLKRVAPPPRPRSLDLSTSKLQQYPVLSGDLAQPDLYEDDWLRHQEVALTELVNEVFNSAERKEDHWHGANMGTRDRLVEIYHQPHVSTLHQRLQASIQYGALSTPKDSVPILPSQDIGLRKRFLGLWLESYDESLLAAAAEVVIGRQIPRRSESAGRAQIEDTMDPQPQRRGLVRFLETFFVEMHDCPADLDNEGRWRKMIARSLMLIWLLDQAKTFHAIQGCLFKTSSPRKSSAQMLKTLATLALPSIGDVTRALRHCNFAVSHQQDPLDEVVYQIHNMASDMRDGIFLTRLVEVLLFSAQNMRIKGMDSGDATITIQLPDKEHIWTAADHGTDDQYPRILSQHLKMPCLGRAQKVFNVDIALAALRSHGRLGEGVAHIGAEDLVNGHREKTLSLLWSLASTYGLESLVDFRELVRDIRRRDDRAEIPQDLTYHSHYQQEKLLQTWAATICARANVQVNNLTTAFADGKAYAAIVEAFAPFCGVSAPTSSDHGHSTAALLRALNCSQAFTLSLTTAHHSIHSRQTTLSNLAFLASRLLPLQRRHVAAITVQCAYRLHHSKTLISQRLKLLRLAHACATVVQTRNRVVGAAVALQRAWREVLGARIRRLDASVMGFQGLAKGWLARRRSKADQKGNMGRRSVMGGW